MKKIDVSKCENREHYLVCCPAFCESSFEVAEFSNGGLISQGNGGVIPESMILDIYTLPKIHY